MADIRINSLPSTATSFNTDDYIPIDGASGGTRKMLAATLPLTDVKFGGTSGPSAKSSIAARAARQGLVFDGTAGGTIANAATIGTADFTIAVWMNLRSTAGSQFILTNSIGTSNFQTSVTDLVMYRSTGSTIATSTSPLVANKTQLIVYTRSGTTGQFYVNGVAFEGTKTDANSYTTFSDIGGVGSSSPCNGTLIPFLYNRALSAAEVVSLYEAGVPSGSDYNNASNTSLLTGANSDFSSAGNWSVQGATTISGGKLNLSNGDAAYNGLAPLTVGKRYRLTITVDSLTAGLVQYYNGSTYVAFASAPGTYTVDFTCAATFAPGLHLRSSGGNAVLDTALYYPLGLLLAPDAAQAGGGLTWYDTSGNAANITLPASGVTWNVPSSLKTASGWNYTGQINTTRSGASGGAPSNMGFFAGTAIGGSTDGIGIGDSGAGAYKLIQSYSGALSLNPSGNNVLIGTTTDGGQKLQVAGNVQITNTGANGLVVTNTQGNALAVFNNSAADASGVNNGYFTIQTASSPRWYFGQSVSALSGDFEIYSVALGASAFSLAKSTGNATFAGTISTATNAAKNAIVARYNSSNSLFGVTVNSSGQSVLSENTDASTGSDAYSKTGLPAFRLGNTGGSGTVPFWIDVAASGTAGGAITWTNAFKIDASKNSTFAGTVSPQQAATASAPTYVKGAIYFDTTLNKLRVGGATGWETITSV